MKSLSVSNSLLYKAATLLLFTVALNSDWKATGIVWWGTLAVFVFSYFLTFGMNIGFEKKYLLWTMSFFAFSFLSVLWALNDSLVIESIKSMLITTAVLLLLYSSIQTKKDIEDNLVIFVFSCLINAVYLLFQNAGTLMSFGAKEDDFFRLGTEGNWNANIIGMMMAFSAIIILYFLQRKFGLLKKAVMYACLVLFVFVSLVTGSRKALLMVLIGIIMMLVFNSKGKKMRTLLTVIAVGGILLYIVYNVEFFYNIIGYRMEGFMAQITGEGEVDNSTKIRGDFIAAAIQVFKEYPLLGCGVNCFRELNAGITGYNWYSHNNYTELLSCLGIVGFSIYYGGYVYVLGGLFKKFKEMSLARLMLCCIVLILIASYACVIYDVFLFGLLIMFAFSVIYVADLEK